MEADAINQQIKIIQTTSREQDPYAHLLITKTYALPSYPLDEIFQAEQEARDRNSESIVMRNLYLDLFQQRHFKSVADEITKQFGESVEQIEFLNVSAEFGGEQLDMGEYRTSRLPMSCGYLITFKGENGNPGRRVFGPMVATDLKLLFELRDNDGFDVDELLKFQVGFGYRHLEAMKAELEKEPKDRKYDAIYYAFPAPAGFEKGKTNLILKALETTLKQQDQGGGKSRVTVQFGDLSEDEIKVLEGIAEIHNQHFLSMVEGKEFSQSQEEERKYTVQLARALMQRAASLCALKK